MFINYFATTLHLTKEFSRNKVSLTESSLEDCIPWQNIPGTFQNQSVKTFFRDWKNRLFSIHWTGSPRCDLCHL